MNTDPPPISADWYFSRDGKVTEGPVPLNEIHSMIATGVLSPRSLVVAVGENVWKSVEVAFPELLPPPAPASLPPSLPPPLQASAPVPAPPVQAASVAPVGGNASSWFAKLGCVGKLAVVCGAGLLLLIVLAGLASGPNRQQLQAELAQIDAEMYQLQLVAASLESKVSASEAQMLKGLVGMGSGMAADNEHQTWSGVDHLASGAIDADYAEMQLQEVVARARQLLARRNEIVSELR